MGDLEDIDSGDDIRCKEESDIDKVLSDHERETSNAESKKDVESEDNFENIDSGDELDLASFNELDWSSGTDSSEEEYYQDKVLHSDDQDDTSKNGLKGEIDQENKEGKSKEKDLEDIDSD